jgi:hypothetical protein
MNNFILTIDPIPEQNWKKNLAHFLPKEKWDILRRNIYKQYGYKCGICNAVGVMNCHEMWIFDDKKHTQKLIGLIALCTKCHDVKHLGRSLAMVAQKVYTQEYYLELINHFLTTNKCTIEDFYEYQTKVKVELKMHSENKYTVDFGMLNYKTLQPKKQGGDFVNI